MVLEKKTKTTNKTRNKTKKSSSQQRTKIRRDNDTFNLDIHKKLKKLDKKNKKKKPVSAIKVKTSKVKKVRELKKRRQERGKAVVGGELLAGIGDKVYWIDTDEDYGIITYYNRRNRTYHTDKDMELPMDDEGRTWDIIYYNLYLLTLNTRSRNKPYPAWPYGIDGSYGNNSNNSNNSEYDDRLLDSVVVSATSEEDARNFLVEEGYTGIEDKYENGDSLESSVWLDDSLTYCKYIGEAYYQRAMLYCRSFY